MTMIDGRNDQAEQYLPEVERLQVNELEYLASASYSAYNDLSGGVNDTPPARDLDMTPPIVNKVFRIDVLAGIGSLTIMPQLRGLEIGFLARSVVIDNATGQWFWSPQLNQMIAPWHIGLIRNIAGGCQTAEFIAMTPPGKASAPVASQYVTLTFYSVNRNPDPGIIAP